MANLRTLKLHPSFLVRRKVFWFWSIWTIFSSRIASYHVHLKMLIRFYDKLSSNVSRMCQHFNKINYPKTRSRFTLLCSSSIHVNHCWFDYFTAFSIVKRYAHLTHPFSWLKFMFPLCCYNLRPITFFMSIFLSLLQSRYIGRRNPIYSC